MRAGAGDLGQVNSLFRRNPPRKVAERLGKRGSEAAGDYDNRTRIVLRRLMREGEVRDEAEMREQRRADETAQFLDGRDRRGGIEEAPMIQPEESVERRTCSDQGRARGRPTR